MTTKRSAAAATIFSRRWAPPPPLISQPSGVTWSVPSIAMSSLPQRAEPLDRDAQLARLFLGRHRGGDAADAADAAGGRSPAAGGRPSSRCPARPSSRPRPTPPPPPPRFASRCQPRSRRALYADGTSICYFQENVFARSIYARGWMDARIWLTGASGEAPQSVALTGERTVVGRNSEAEIQIDDEAVSWNHLEIESRGGVLMATDLDSRNGTALNGEPLDRPRRLRDGDTLIVGGHRLEVSTGPARAGGATVRQRRAPVALNEEERATATALVAPYRSEGAFAGRPATRAEIAEAAARQRAHRPAPPRRACRQARRRRRRRPRAPPPDRRPRDRARPRPLP